MKFVNSLLFLLVTIAFVLSGCVSIPSTGCVNDNYCSINEQLIGNCADCLADLAVDKESFTVDYYQDDKQLRGYVCVENLHGNFEGDVDIKWEYISQNARVPTEYTDTDHLTLTTPVAHGSFDINVRDGKLIYESRAEAGDDTERRCFSHSFENVQPSTSFTMQFSILSSSVKEKETRNNEAALTISYNERYPDFLIERTIENNIKQAIYQNSRSETTDQPVSHVRYVAAYNNSNETWYATVLSMPSAEDAKAVITNLTLRQLPESTIRYINIQNHVVIFYVDTYVWYTGKYVISVRYINRLRGSQQPDVNDLVLLEYLNKYPSLVAMPQFSTLIQRDIGSADYTSSAKTIVTTFGSFGEVQINDATYSKGSSFRDYLVSTLSFRSNESAAEYLKMVLTEELRRPGGLMNITIGAGIAAGATVYGVDSSYLWRSGRVIVIVQTPAALFSPLYDTVALAYVEKHIPAGDVIVGTTPVIPPAPGLKDGSVIKGTIWNSANTRDVEVLVNVSNNLTGLGYSIPTGFSRIFPNDYTNISASYLQAAYLDSNVTIVVFNGKARIIVGTRLGNVTNGLRYIANANSSMLDLLADGTVYNENSNIDYSYGQSFSLTQNTVSRLDSRNSLWNYSLNFKIRGLDVVTLDDSESVNMLGKTFIIDPSNTAAGEIKLIKSDVTRSFIYGATPVTVVVGGVAYAVSITGGDVTGNKVTVTVNGQSQIITEGQSKTINGLKIYARTVTVNEQPVFSASATLDLGVTDIILPAASSTCTWTSVRINGNSISGVDACVIGTSNSAISKIQFRYSPSDLPTDIAGITPVDNIAIGTELRDPLFGTVTISAIYSFGSNIDAIIANITHYLRTNSIEFAIVYSSSVTTSDFRELFARNVVEDSFKVENGLYTFNVNGILDGGFTIDGVPVANVQYGAVGGGAVYSWYKVPCKEGRELRAVASTGASGDLIIFTKNIAGLKCA